MPLHTIEEQLPQGEFIRIHHSFLVSRCRISRFSWSEVTLTKDEKILPIGKKYLDDVIQQLKDY